MYVCICKAVTDEEISELLAAGCKNVRDLQKKCRVGADCGCCLNAVREMVDQTRNTPHESHQKVSDIKD